MREFTKVFERVPAARRRYGSKTYVYGQVWLTLPPDCVGKKAIVKVLVLDKPGERFPAPQPQAGQPAPSLDIDAVLDSIIKALKGQGGQPGQASQNPLSRVPPHLKREAIAELLRRHGISFEVGRSGALIVRSAPTPKVGRRDTAGEEVEKELESIIEELLAEGGGAGETTSP